MMPVSGHQHVDVGLCDSKNCGWPQARLGKYLSARARHDPASIRRVIGWLIPANPSEIEGLGWRKKSVAQLSLNRGQNSAREQQLRQLLARL